MQFSKYKIVVGGTRAARDKYRKEFDCFSEATKRFDKLKAAAPRDVHTLYLIGEEPGGVQRLVRVLSFRTGNNS
jgi:hypothetical protein